MKIRPQSAFTLLEAMIAAGLLFMGLFAILEMTSRSLRGARSLQKSNVDIGSLASDLALTNRLEEGGSSGDFGGLYPGYAWTRDITLVSSNGLYQVDFTVFSNRQKPPVETKLSILLYRPDSSVIGAGSRIR